MADKHDLRAVCRTCLRAITERAKGEYARSLPMCASCEEQAFLDIRPSPRNRKQRRDKMR